MSKETAATHRTILLAATIVPIAAVFLFVDTYPQPTDYYEFADTREFFGIANFCNVISNLPFLIFGVAGLYRVLTQGDLAILHSLKSAYIVLFIGIALTAFGSGWFHLAPRNDTLFWDRMPMTIAFMPLFAIILGEHVSESFARSLFWPLLAIGVGSVFYWDYSESQGRGDLRLYGLVQFLPIMLIPLVLWLYRSAFDNHRFYWLAIGLYVLAKLFEQLDAYIYSLGGVMSGHTLKHLVASLVPWILLWGFRNRDLTEKSRLPHESPSGPPHEI